MSLSESSSPTAWIMASLALCGSGALGLCTNLRIVVRMNPASVSGSFSYRCIRPPAVAQKSASSACGTRGRSFLSITVLANESNARGMR